MNRLTAIGLVSLVAYALLIGSKYAGFVSAAREERTPAPAAQHEAAGIPEVALVPPQEALAPQRPATMPPPVTRAQPARASTVALQFRSARDLKAYADGLMSRRGSLTSDENYYLAKALEECQFATTMNEDLAAYSAKQRREFISRLGEDPKKASRIAAYDAVDSSQRCLRFQNAKIAAKDIEDLYRAAAMQGGAAAQGRMLVAELNKNLSSSRAVQETPSTPIDDFSRITSLLESKDPEAIMIVGQFLAQSALTNQLHIGPTGEAPEPAAFLGAFSLVACDFGPDCEQLKPELQLACAHGGYCDAQTFEDLYQNFMASPWVFVNAMRYRGIIRNAIQTQNWSLIGLTPKAIAQMRDKIAALGLDDLND
jgi:hypothetical protein